MKIVAFILAFLLATKALAAPCAADDNDCLLRLTLQQTYDLEASRQENAIMQKRLSQAESRASDGGKIFAIGMIAGIVFVGLGATLAMKAMK